MGNRVILLQLHLIIHVPEVLIPVAFHIDKITHFWYTAVFVFNHDIIRDLAVTNTCSLLTIYIMVYFIMNYRAISQNQLMRLHWVMHTWCRKQTICRAIIFYPGNTTVFRVILYKKGHIFSCGCRFSSHWTIKVIKSIKHHTE